MLKFLLQRKELSCSHSILPIVVLIKYLQNDALLCSYLYNIKYGGPCAVLSLNCVAHMVVKSFRANTILGYVFIACTEYWRSSLVYSKGVIFITVTEKGLENSYTESVSGTSVPFLMILNFSSKPSIFTSCFRFS